MTPVDTLPNQYNNSLQAPHCQFQNLIWKGSLDTLSFEQSAIKDKLLTLNKPCYFVKVGGKIGVTHEGYLSSPENTSSILRVPINTTPTAQLLTFIPPMTLQQLGDPNFLAFHGVKYAYVTGAMAGGIAPVT